MKADDKLNYKLEKDYYKTLGLARTVSETSIADNFRKLALKWHPKKNTDDPYAAQQIFADICEAYEVLSDPKKKSIYDQYGEHLLKEGFVDPQGGFKGGYKFNGNPEEIFESFFGTNNPYINLFDNAGELGEIGTMFGFAYGGVQQNFDLPAPEELNVSVVCTLKELYEGCTKTINYDRVVLNADGKTTSQKTETKQLEIKRGYSQGTALRYPQEGNEASGHLSSDLVFTIAEDKHLNYKRVKNDLYYTATISLLAALKAHPIQLETLDGRCLSVSIDEVISPQTKRRVTGEGMPIYREVNSTEAFMQTEKKGDLYVQFNIVFPKYIPHEKRERLEEFLPEN